MARKNNPIDILLARLAERPIAFHPVFAKVFGDINTALFFQQIYYWSDKGSREDGYIYKTKNEITEETTLSERQQDRVRKILENEGVLYTKKLKVNGSPVIHYKPNLRKVYESILEHYKMSDSSISKSTTKNTHSNFSEEKSPSPLKEEKNKSILRIMNEFKRLSIKYLDKEPLLGGTEYKIVQRVLGGLTEEKIFDLLDWWFTLGKPDQETIHLRKALSNFRVNEYKALYG